MSFCGTAVFTSICLKSAPSYMKVKTQGGGSLKENSEIK